MTIKTATKLGLIGAIITILISFFYILLNLEIITLVSEDTDYETRATVYTCYYVGINLLTALSAFSLANFFYILYKNQK